MSYLQDEENIKAVIEQNNSLIRKKNALKILLDHTETKLVLKEALDRRTEWVKNANDEKYIELLEILEKNSWNLDHAIDHIIKDVSKDVNN